ncbi:MAG: CIA30 family protein [Planctomycetota bacterium]
MRTSFMIAVLLTVLVASLCLARSSAATASEQRAKGTIVDLAVANDSLTTLVAALQAADLVDVLAGEGPFTVFAPTDKAFASLPDGTLESLLQPQNRDTLVRILAHHVAPGSLDATTALTTGTLTTLADTSVTVSLQQGRLRVGDAQIIVNDVVAANGVVHVIDTVLLPPALPRAEEPIELADTPEKALFVLAIERGAPIFNDGNPAACAAIYEVAVQAVLALRDGISETDRVTLEFALNEARGIDDATSQAWTLRRAMDKLLLAATPASAGNTHAANRAVHTRTVFDFEDMRRRDHWFTVNDDVMGGISRARFETTAHDTARFAGALSLENNGGFATVRSPGRDLELSGMDGLVMRVRGDGRRYGFSVMPSDRRYEINMWRTEFTTEPGVWQEVRVPFTAFVHQVMGRRFPQNGHLPPERIRAMAFSISDKNEKPFALEIDWIAAYSEGSSPAL